MRYIKVSPGITLRVPNVSIDSADFIMSRWRDNAQAFKRVSDWLCAELEIIEDWKVETYEGKNINYAKIKVKDFWGPDMEWDMEASRKIYEGKS